jgi:hypothetical protein
MELKPYDFSEWETEHLQDRLAYIHNHQVIVPLHGERQEFFEHEARHLTFELTWRIGQTVVPKPELLKAQ